MIFSEVCFIDFIVPVVSLAGIVVSVLIVNKQLRYQLFADYAKRYEGLMQKIAETESGKLQMEYARMYIDLCSEEYVLHKHSIVKGEMWEHWKDGMQYQFSKPLYSLLWEQSQMEHYYDRDFTEFINSLLSRSQALEK